MCEAPGSVVTLLCSGIQLYSAERRIADCILADVKRASMCTSAELARLSCSSEATVTRLCHIVETCIVHDRISSSELLSKLRITQ